jgi:hypothetical protein
MEKEKLDRLTAALNDAGYKIIALQMDEYPYEYMPTAIGDEARRLTGGVRLRLFPITVSGE